MNNMLDALGSSFRTQDAAAMADSSGSATSASSAAGPRKRRSSAFFETLKGVAFGHENTPSPVDETIAPISDNTPSPGRKRHVGFADVVEVHTVERKRGSLIGSMFYSARDILQFKDEKFEEEAEEQRLEKERQKADKKKEREAKKAERKAKLAARKAKRTASNDVKQEEQKEELEQDHKEPLEEDRIPPLVKDPDTLDPPETEATANSPLDLDLCTTTAPETSASDHPQRNSINILDPSSDDLSKEFTNLRHKRKSLFDTHEDSIVLSCKRQSDQARSVSLLIATSEAAAATSSKAVQQVPQSTTKTSAASDEQVHIPANSFKMPDDSENDTMDANNSVASEQSSNVPATVPQPPPLPEEDQQPNAPESQPQPQKQPAMPQPPQPPQPPLELNLPPSPETERKQRITDQRLSRRHRHHHHNHHHKHRHQTSNHCDHKSRVKRTTSFHKVGKLLRKLTGNKKKSKKKEHHNNEQIQTGETQTRAYNWEEHPQPNENERNQQIQDHSANSQTSSRNSNASTITDYDNNSTRNSNASTLSDYNLKSSTCSDSNNSVGAYDWGHHQPHNRPSKGTLASVPELPLEDQEQSESQSFAQAKQGDELSEATKSFLYEIEEHPRRSSSSLLRLMKKFLREKKKEKESKKLKRKQQKQHRHHRTDTTPFDISLAAPSQGNHDRGDNNAKHERMPVSASGQGMPSTSGGDPSYYDWQHHDDLKKVPHERSNSFLGRLFRSSSKRRARKRSDEEEQNRRDRFLAGQNKEQAGSLDAAQRRSDEEEQNRRDKFLAGQNIEQAGSLDGAKASSGAAFTGPLHDLVDMGTA